MFRSLQHIYAQVIDDSRGVTLASASTKAAADAAGAGAKTEQARAVGRTLAERARAQGIQAVVFDRSGYLYHGRVKALADGAREAGLEF